MKNFCIEPNEKGREMCEKGREMCEAQLQKLVFTRL